MNQASRGRPDGSFQQNISRHGRANPDVVSSEPAFDVPHSNSCNNPEGNYQMLKDGRDSEVDFNPPVVVINEDIYTMPVKKNCRK